MSKRSHDGQKKTDTGSPFKIPDKEMILTRGRTVKLKRQLRITSLQKSSEKQPPKSPKSPTKITVKSNRVPDKSSHSTGRRPAKKIMLKPPQKTKGVETSLKKNNKRKSNCPKRSIVQSPPKREEKSKNVAVANSKAEIKSHKQPPTASLRERLLEAEKTRRCSFAELIRERETTEELTDEDLLEIVQCPSPVWWEDPPSEIYDEDPIFFPSLIKMKPPDDDILKTEELNVLRIPDNKCEPKFLEKRSTLEKVLKNLKTNNDCRNKSVAKPDKKIFESQNYKKNNNDDDNNISKKETDKNDENKPGTSKLQPAEHISGSKVEKETTQKTISDPSIVNTKLKDLVKKMHSHLPNVKCVTALTMKQKQNKVTNKETDFVQSLPAKVDVIDLSNDDCEKKEIITIKDSPIPSASDSPVDDRSRLDETKVLNDLENLKIPINLDNKEFIVIDEEDHVNPKDAAAFLDKPESTVTAIEDAPELESDEDNVFVMGIQNYVDISDFETQNNESISLKTDSEIDVLSLDTRNDETTCLETETDEDVNKSKNKQINQIDVINQRSDDDTKKVNNLLKSDLELILEENGISIVDMPRDNDDLIKRCPCREDKPLDPEYQDTQLDKRKDVLDYENPKQCLTVAKAGISQCDEIDAKRKNVANSGNSFDPIYIKRKSVDDLKNPKVKIIRIEHDKSIVQVNKFDIGANCDEFKGHNVCKKESKVINKVPIDIGAINSALPENFEVENDLKMRLRPADTGHESNMTDKETISTNLKVSASKIQLVYKELVAKYKTKIQNKKEVGNCTNSTNRNKLVNFHVMSKTEDKSECRGEIQNERVSLKDGATNEIEKKNIESKTSEKSTAVHISGDCMPLSHKVVTSETKLLESSDKKKFEETETYSDEDAENDCEDVDKITMTKEMIDSIIGIENSTNPKALEQIVLHDVNKGLVSQRVVDTAQKENFKYCFKCSSIYETAECMYCIKPTVVTKKIEASIYSCDLCQYQCKKRCYMDAHSICHAKEKPYSCDSCKNTFKTKSTLRSHIQRFCRIDSTDVSTLKSETATTDSMVNLSPEKRSNITDGSQEEVRLLENYVNNPNQKQILDDKSGYVVILTKS